MTLTRPYVLAVAVAATALFLLLGPTPAQAKPSPCWKVLINDWYDGRIDGTYAIPCYREALRRLPKDVQEYSSARDDIRQALQKRITQSLPGSGGNTDTGSSDGDGQAGHPAPPAGGGPGDAGGPAPGSGGDTTATPGRDTDGLVPGAGSADSVPVPLIVLGSLAALLMAAGAAGFVLRRTRARRLQLAAAAAVSKRPGDPPPAQ